jgi:hypothetical protein
MEGEAIMTVTLRTAFEDAVAFQNFDSRSQGLDKQRDQVRFGLGKI